MYPKTTTYRDTKLRNPYERCEFAFAEGNGSRRHDRFDDLEKNQGRPKWVEFAANAITGARSITTA